MLYRKFMYIPAVIATLAIPAAANAYCPVLEDLYEGVILERHNPAFEATWIRSGSGLSETRRQIVQGMPETVKENYAHALAVSEVWRNGNIYRISYKRDPSDLDNMKPSDTWKSAIRITENGKPLDTGKVTYTFMANDRIDIHDCSYKVVWVEVETRLNGADTIYFQHAFAPSLGLSLAAYRLDEHRLPVSEVLYDHVKKK